VTSWSFLANHSRTPLCIARPWARSCATPAASRGSACGIVTGLPVASYMIKGKDSRRDRHQIQAHLRCRTCQPEPATGEALALLAGVGAGLQLTGTGPSLGYLRCGPARRHRRSTDLPFPRAYHVRLADHDYSADRRLSD
jgi:hypothetical protein